MQELLALLFIGQVQGIDEHECFFIRSDVATNSLAKHTRVAIDIEEIVLQLEGQSHLFAKLIERLGILFGSICQNGAHLRGASQQNTCL